MYLRKLKNKKTGRIYLTIMQGYRDKNGKSKSTTISSLGYLDDLEKKYNDPIAHFENEINQMNDQKSADEMPISVNTKDFLDVGQSNRKNFGYAPLCKIYHELGIDQFLKNRQRSTKFEFDSNNIMKLLVFSRMLYPASKKKTYESKDMFFENSDFSLDDVYRCLTFFNTHKDALMLWIHEYIKAQYKRDTSLVYYDLTNYYFEIDEQDELRKNGVSKEHRPDPIVQMGLFMDTNGLPITYRLFPGNTQDKTTLIPMMSRIQHDFSLGKIIVVADKGIITGDNIGYTLSAGNGYVFSYSVLCADHKFKEYVLDEGGYVWQGKDFKIKSRLYPREINITMTNGKKRKKAVDEKHVIFYSRKYDEKAKRDRAGALEKAKDLISNPEKYNRTTSYGAAKYVKNIVFDKETGEVLKKPGKVLEFNEELLKQEEMYDGYYAIVTSEYEKSAEEIVEIYRGLWKIEESFKVTKGEFDARPVYVSRQDHIEAHFLTCFVSLVIARILELRLGRKYYVGRMLESLSKACCTHMQENYYIFDYYDEVLADIGKEFGIDFSRKYMRLADMKKIMGQAKKR